MSDLPGSPPNVPVSDLDGLQAKMREALAAGVVPLEVEIQTRSMFSECLFQRFNQLSNPQDLYDAIQHVETILRRLPASSPKLSEYLNRLSFMKVSEYGITNIPSTLDEAVTLGLKARDEAMKTNVLSSDPEKYFEILNNLGYAQSHRHGESKRSEDLDDAIEFGRELLRLVPRSSRYYNMALLNLASRFRVRYNERDNIADHEEAIRLINMQLEGTGTRDMSIIAQAGGLIQLAELALEKYEKDGSLDSLDEAIRQGKAALDKMPIQHEKYADLLKRVSQMYAFRYDKTKSLDDAKTAVLYSKIRVQCLPASHPATGTHLWQYMLYACHVAESSSELSDVENVLKESVTLMEGMPDQYARREACQWILGDMLSQRYTLSKRLEDIIEVVEQNKRICLEHNERMADEGGEDVAVEKIYSLIASLWSIEKAPDDNPIKTLIVKKLPGYFLSACQLSGIPNAPIALYNAHGTELAMYTELVESEKTVAVDNVEERIKNMAIKAKEANEAAQKRRNSPSWRPKDYETEFGVRALQIDKRTGKIIFNVPSLVEDTFGYATQEPLPMDQFIQREQQLEQDTRENETRDGMNPNPKLCRVCRRLKILKPTDSGFQWSDTVKYVPFGNYGQIVCRQSCGICRLILTHISNPQRTALHPRLEAIDPEVQGTSLEPVKLKSGEEVLQVMYGLREVGALRIVEASDWHQASDQDFKTNTELSLDGSVTSKNFSASSRGQIVPLLVLRKWLNNCDHNHGRQCNGNFTDSCTIEMLHIDVVDECLVRGDSNIKYFALSYVWGKVKMSETLKSNLKGRLEKGGLKVGPNNPLPKTIQDAMILIKSLGERYLWIDALCIVQDDMENKLRDIQQMDVVYNKAFATIVAMDGLDADSGLPGVRPQTRPPQTIEKIVVSNRSPDLAYISQHESNEEIHVVTTPTPLSLTLDNSKWESRGWTFQERLLSRRCVYFSKNWAYFQCSKEILDEAGIDALVMGPSFRALENPLLDLRKLEGEKKHQVLRANFNAYKDLVEKYTIRELSFPADVLKAFGGVFSILTGKLQGSTLFGLPATFLDLALLWTPAAPLKQRLDAVTLSDYPQGSGRTVESVCPTWSWAGFIGPVEYHLFSQDQPRPLPTPLIDSFQIRHGSWLYTAQSAGKATYQVGSSSGDRESSHGELGWTEEIGEVNQDSKKTLRSPALGPGVLQFEAWVVPVSKFKAGTELELLSQQENIHTSSEQGVQRLYDSRGKHCGFCFGLATTAMNLQATNPPSLVAISQHEETGRPYKGPDRVEGEVPMFNRDVYPAAGPGSGLINALVVSWGDGDVAERVTVVRIHARAWEEAGPVKKWISLG